MKENRNESIGYKINRGYAILIVSMAFIAIVVLAVLFWLTGQYRAALDDYGFSQGDVGKIGITFQKECTLSRDLLLAPDAAEQGEAVEALQKNRESFEDILSNAMKFIQAPEVVDALEKISGDYSGFRQLTDESISLAGKGAREEAYTLLNTQAKQIADSIEAQIEDTMDVTLQRGKEIAAKINRIRMILVVCVVLFVLTAVFISLRVSGTIVRQIREAIQDMLEAARKISLGELEVQIKTSSRDEIGSLAMAFREMLKHFREYIDAIGRVTSDLEDHRLDISVTEEFYGEFSQIKDSLNNTIRSLNQAFREMSGAAVQVERKSEQTAGHAKLLEENTLQQAAIIEELAASLNLLTENVKQNACEAGSARELSGGTCVIADAGSANMKEMVGAMEQIHASTDKIQVISKTIQDIAVQTNLLSLNAAIEAARAGEAGRGFAVVADEIRALAEESRESAQRIMGLIEECVSASDSGVRIVRETADTLDQIVEGVRKSGDIVTGIAQMSSEEAASLSEASERVNGLAGLMQTNRDLSGEGAGAAAELQEQSELLKNYIQQFEL